MIQIKHQIFSKQLRLELYSENFKSGIQTQFLSKIKNINYEAKNIEEFKENTTNEIFGSGL